MARLTLPCARARLSAGTRLTAWLRRRGLLGGSSWRGPHISAPCGHLQPGKGPFTFVVVCGALFDQRIPNAATLMRLGWCHGFQALGVPYRLVSAFDLERVLPTLPDPVCWISGSDYAYLSPAGRRSLAQHPHAALVNMCFEGDEALYRRQGYPSQAWSKRLRERVRASDPRFVFTLSGEARFAFYEGWRRAGLRLASLPLACDTALYEPAPREGRFSDVEIAFVGGYWDYKARQLDRYLAPWASQLRVFGYSSWPYGHFGGQLPLAAEPLLYAQARVSPVINEPHACALGVDINERVFKVLGAGGLALTDPTPAYREWFSADELLVPGSADEYHELMAAALAHPESFERLRAQGQRAVRQRHTYVHRAQAFCGHLGIAQPVAPAIGTVQ